MAELSFEPDATAMVGASLRLPDPRKEIDPTTGQVLGAAFRRENVFGMVAERLATGGADQTLIDPFGSVDTDTTFDPFKNIQGYEDHASAFKLANSPEEVDTIKRRIDQERRDMEILDASGSLGFVSSILAGAVDPINFIPVGGAAVKAARAGQRFVGGFKSTARAGFISVGLQEVGLGLGQETRTVTEGVLNIAAGTALAGILGGSAGAVFGRYSKGRVDGDAQTGAHRAEGDFVNDVTPPPDHMPDPYDPSGMSVSARQADSQPPTLTRSVEDLARRAADDTEVFELTPAGRFVRNDAGSADLGAAPRIGDGDVSVPIRLARRDIEHLDSTLKHQDAVAAGYRDGLELAMDVIDNWAFIREAAAADRLHLTRENGVARVVLVELRLDPSGEFYRVVTAGLRSKENVEKLGLLGTRPRNPGGDASSPSSFRSAPEDAGDGRLDSAQSPSNKQNIGDDKPEFKLEDIGEVDIPEPPDDGDISVGAMMVHKPTLGALKKAYGLEKILGAENKAGEVFASPIIRAVTSPSEATRRIATELVDTPVFFEGNARGVATPVSVETRTRAWTAAHGEVVQELDRLFLKHRGVKGRRRTLAKDVLSDPPEGMLTFRQFKEEISFAMRRGDKHHIPEVAEAARTMRKRVFDPLKDIAIEKGLLPEDVRVETAVSYLTRVYNVEKIIAERKHWVEEIVTPWLARQHPDLEVGELLEIADAITNKILGTSDGRIPYDAVSLARGPLKERTFSIPDELIEGYLENDIEMILGFYRRTLAPDVELTGRFGSPDMAEQVQEIVDEFDGMIRQAKTAKQSKALEKRKQIDIRDIEAMRDRLRGTYAAPADPNSVFVRTARGVKQANFLRLLGGMTLSAFPDIGRLATIDNVGRFYGAGLKPLLTNLQGVKLAGKEARLAGQAWDLALDTRALSLADIGDQFGRHSKFERGLTAATNNFGLVSLMSPWNAWMKNVTSAVTMSKMFDAALRLNKTGKLSKANTERFAMMGVDPAMVRRLGEQFEQFGVREGELYLPNTEKWVDAEAREMFRAALSKEIDRVIVTPGVGDRPLWMSTQLGGVIGQFRSFSFASANRVLLSGVQQGDAATLSGALISMALGMGVYATKTWLAGREVSTDPFIVMSEGFDRSGLTGWFFDLHNIVEKATRGSIGINRIVGGPTMSRYASRNTVGAIFGPSLGTVTDIFRVVGSSFSMDFNRGDVRAIRRLLPYQNLFYLRTLFDEAEEGIAQSLGVPGRR
ncbi:MAG: hypothetical protein GY953_39290 [bacterium]|nr:hypothetical protein [bacterium]